MRSNESDSPDRTLSDDQGDDVQQRFRYQHSYVTLLAVEMCRQNVPYKEIFCEQHEDAMAKRIHDKFEGIQIKTREKPVPFTVFDHEIKKSIKRFILLENKFRGHFTKFIIVSNCGFNIETSSLIESLNTSQKDSETVQLRRKVNRFIRKMVDESESSKRTVLNVLSMLEFQQGPQFDDIDSKIIEAHLGNLTSCQGLNLGDLRQILEKIEHLVYNASSRRISDPISDYLSFIKNGRSMKISHEIEEKRITTSKVIKIVEDNINSINAINRTKDSLLELVDVEIVDDKKDNFPQLDIKIRNVGDRIAVLKRAEFHVSRTWTLLNPWKPRAIPISCNYDALLPISKYPNIETIPLSQAVDPNNVDRFTITLGRDGARVPSKHVYQLRLLLLYDGDNKTVQTQDMLFLSRVPCRILGAHTQRSRMEYCKKHNIMALAEIKNINGIKSRALTQIINEYSDTGEVPYP